MEIGDLTSPPRSPTRGSLLRRTLFTLPIAAGALYLALRDVGVDELAAVVRGLQFSWLFLAVVAMASQLTVRLLRWTRLVRTQGPVSFADSMRIGAVGFLAIDLFPLRLGELVRPVLLARRTAVPFAASMAIILVERIFDLIAVQVFLIAALFAADLPSLKVTVAGNVVDLSVQGRNAGLFLLSVATLPILAFLALGERGLDGFERMLAGLPLRLRSPVVHAVRNFADALRRVGQPGALTMVAALTFCCWTMNVLVAAFLLRAFGIDQIGTMEVVLIVIVVALCLLIPSPVGGVGVFEIGAISGLSLYGVDAVRSVAFALALHSTHVAVAVVAGSAVLMGGRLRLREVWRAGSLQA